MFFRNAGAVCLIVIVLAAVGCSGNNSSNLSEQAPVPAAVQLPSLGNLPVPTASARHRSAFAYYDLLAVEPVLVSPDGSAVHGMGEAVLDPALHGGLAWAVYALPGFPPDDQITPVGITVDSGTAPVWVAYSNYLSGRWEFLHYDLPDTTFLPDSFGLVSGEGVFYVVVLAEAGAATVTGLTVSTTDDLPGGPVAVLNLIGGAAAGMPATFTAEGSHGGDGTLTELTYTFDGADP